MNAVCLVVDRLHQGFLGAYGNTWIATGDFDRLASQSFVFDQAHAESLRLDQLYRAYWQGLHPLASPTAELPSLAQRLAAAGVHTALWTDEPQVADHPLAAHFAQREEFPLPQPGPLAPTLDDTHLAGCFSELIEHLEAARPPFFTWCHLASLGKTWDAPRALRDRYVEEGDPPLGSWSDVPRQALAADYDPDEVVSAIHAYAGQVTLWDACLGALLELFEEHPLGRDTLLIVTAARGLALGEQPRIGPWDDLPCGALVQVPLVVRLPDATGAAARSQALVGSSDLFPTLAQWFNVEGQPPRSAGRCLLPVIRDEHTAWRDRLVLAGDSPWRAIRTPGWQLRAQADQPAELFAKPDDRWEVNNVADRCQEIVEPLRQRMEETLQAVTENTADALPPLDDVLQHGIG